MTSESWIVDSLGVEKFHHAAEEAGRRRLGDTLGIGGTGRLDDDHLRFVANALELRVTLLLDDENPADLCAAAAEAFQVARVLRHDGTPTETAQSLVRLGCLGVLGDRGADVRRLLVANGWPALPVDADDWGQRVWSTILDVWLRLFRKQGWDDLDAVQGRVADLRASQREYEPRFLHDAEQRQDAGPAWELMTTYHLRRRQRSWASTCHREPSMGATTSGSNSKRSSTEPSRPLPPAGSWSGKRSCACSPALHAHSSATASGRHPHREQPRLDVRRIDDPARPSATDLRVARGRTYGDRPDVYVVRERPEIIQSGRISRRPRSSWKAPSNESGNDGAF